jgi:hypothetical protein
MDIVQKVNDCIVTYRLDRCTISAGLHVLPPADLYVDVILVVCET